MRALYILVGLVFIGCFVTEQADGKMIKSSPKAGDLNKFLTQDVRKISAADRQKANQLRIRTINSIDKLLKGKMSKNRKFELYLRLGELYHENHDFLREQEIDEFEAKFDTWQKKPKKKRGKEPKINHKKSLKSLYTGISILRKLVKEYPRYSRTDAALFTLAKSLSRINNDSSVIYFEKIISKYRKSKFLPETYLALAEHYFYKQKFNKARTYYESALKFKNSKIYTYAVYKLGWNYFNQSTGESSSKKAINRAIAAFKLVVKLSSDEEKGKRGGRFDLRQEAINDLIMVFAEDSRTEEALSYFESIDEKDSFYNTLERMGNIYVDNGENNKAIGVFNRLLDESPNRIGNPNIHLTLINLYDKKGVLGKVAENFETMARLYVESSDWIDENIEIDKNKVKKAAESTQKEIHRYSTLYHKKGMDNKSKKHLTSALKLYKLYLKNFPKAPEAYDLRYYMAEVQFYFKNYDIAADEYYTVSRMNGKYRKTAALSAVASMKNIIDSSKYGKLPPLGQVGSPIEVPENKIKYIKMLDSFVELLPKDKKGHTMRYSAAYTLFEYGHYKDANQRFENIIKLIPGTKQGRSSVKMMIGYHTEKKQWDELIAFCRKYLKDKTIASSNLNSFLKSTLRDSLFSQAVRFNKQRNYARSAQAFSAYQQEFPKAKNADDALYNATLNYYKDGNVEGAISKGKIFVTAYPKSKHIRKVVLDIAQSYEALADFKLAADFFEKFAVTYPRDSKAALALYNAATLLKGLEKNKKSIDLYKRFRRYYPKHKLSKEALSELASLYLKERDYNNAVSYFEKYAWQHPVNSETYLYGMAMAAEIQFNNGNAKGGRQRFKSLYDRLTAKSAKPAFDARRIVARAMFSDVDSEVTSYKKVRITSAKNVESRVKYKERLLRDITKKYQRIVDLGSGEYTVASLYRVGEMNEIFSEDLLSAPAPRGANQHAVDQYRSAMERVALPLQEEAEKYFTLAYTRSKEVQTFTNWTRLARSKMTQIDEKNYPKVNEQNVEAGYLSHRMQWQEQVAKLGN